MLPHFLDLIYPPICCACGKTLIKNEKHLCTYCYLILPIENFNLSNDNDIAKVFWGRTKITSAATLFHFKKESKVQRLVHEIKYHGNDQLAIYLGELFGKRLTQVSTTIDGIIPVPISHKKLKQRGYNQAERIAKGLAQIMDLPVLEDLIKCNSAKSQTTQEGMFNRWLNVINSFELPEVIDDVSNRHLMIVDDVVTTGSTIEACILRLRQIFPNLKISVGSIALAM
ncbi:MAG: ComF family protein [Flavobacteriales bacterium]|nr:ComF family protein [Flavobacteriales bacterium]